MVEDILMAIHEKVSKYIFTFGDRPTYLYLGRHNYEKWREAMAKLVIYKVPVEGKEKTLIMFEGMQVVLVADDEDHLNVSN